MGVPLVLVAAGLLFATSAVTSQGTDLRGGRSDLASVIRAQQRRADSQAAIVAGLRREITAATARTAVSDTGLRAAQAAAARLEAQAGLTSVAGPALSVTLTDAPKPPTGQPLPDGLTYDDFVVHQQDVQAVVNALWRGGAEAMQVMDQRVISTSAVRCVGNTLLLQGRVYAPPYRIVALGDPGRLRTTLEQDSSVRIYRDYVTVIGLGFAVRSQGHAVLPAFSGALALQHARAAG